jgi:hypothetical protein
LQYTIDVLRSLREREIAPTNPTLHHLPSARLQTDLHDLRAFVEGLRLDDYVQVDRPIPMLLREDYQLILARMQQHVLDYGPPNYPRAATYYLLAEMLLHFGLEHGEPMQIARRLQKRLPSIDW